MPTCSPVVVPAGFADIKKQGARLRVISQHLSNILMLSDVPSEPNTESEAGLQGLCPYWNKKNFQKSKRCQRKRVKSSYETILLSQRLDLCLLG